MLRPLLLSHFVSLALSAAIAPSALNLRDTAAKPQVWQPELRSKFQIILNHIVDPSAGDSLLPSDAPIFDVDLADTPKSTIDYLHAQGKKVICYFSAGSSEDWREDYTSFLPDDKGACMEGWPGERWLDVRSANVFAIMQKRIALAKSKGCDGVDPDNVDGYNNKNGKDLKREDSIAFVKKLAEEAHSYGMAIGLKNAQGILPDVLGHIEFAVNEQCAAYEECSNYAALISAKKPVFHIEYTQHGVDSRGNMMLTPDGKEFKGKTSDELKKILCNGEAPDLTKDFSTIVKIMDLDGWGWYCDGSEADTKVLVPKVRDSTECPLPKGQRLGQRK